MRKNYELSSFTKIFNNKKEHSSRLRTILGLTHVIINGTILRTPLGGFYNHSDDANCIKFEKDSHSNYDNTYYFLKTIKDIEKGEELTVNYTLYNIE